MAAKRARNAKGHFIKGSGRKKARKTTALARRATAAPVRRTRTVVVTTGVRRRRRSGGGAGGAGPIAKLKHLAPELVASAGYAYATRASSVTAKKIQYYVAKVPVFSAIGAPATHGILLSFLASQTSGKPRMVCDLLATAALHRAAANLGAVAFDHEAAAKLSGTPDDDGTVAMGGIDPNDVIDAEYDDRDA